MFISFGFFIFNFFILNKIYNKNLSSLLWIIFGFELLLITAITEDINIKEILKNKSINFSIPILIGIIVNILTLLHFIFKIGSYNLYVVVIGTISIISWLTMKSNYGINTSKAYLIGEIILIFGICLGELMS